MDKSKNTEKNQNQTKEQPSQEISEEINEQEKTEVVEEVVEEPIIITDNGESGLSEEFKKIEEYKDITLRLQAEFSNYRKRNQYSVMNARVDGNNDIIEALLPILDNFERGLEVISDDKIKGGVELIYKQLSDLLVKYEVQEIKALGEEFNPNLHHAVAQVEDTDNENKVVAVFQKGYKRKDKILRPAMVKVAK
ncbi:MAG: nucleotide exchange factor GrpE [Clostridia bacterium]